LKFDTQFLDQIRSRLSLSEIVGDSVNLTRKGREHTGLCPFHKEKTPSFTVNDEKEFYHCFGCGAHGDCIRFLVDYKGYPFFDAVKELAQRAGLSLPASYEERSEEKVDSTLYEVMEKAGEWFHKQLFSNGAREAQSYLEQRGMSPSSVKEFKLGYAPRSRRGLKADLLNKGFDEKFLVQAGLLVQPEDGGESYDRFRSRILFPIHDNRGKLVAFGGRILGDGEPKYLNSPETPIFSKGQMLYGYHHARTHMKRGDPVVLGEGYMDVLALRGAGYHGALAPMGTALTEDQISLLWRLSFEPVLCFDGDAAGMKAAQRAAERALPLLRPGYTLKFAHLPKGEDPDSMIRSGRKAQLSQALSQGQSLLDVLWSSLTQGKDLRAPEQQALLLKEIDQLTKQVENTTVASTFRSALKDKYYEQRKYRKLGKASSIQLTRPQNFFDKSVTILLAILLNHPHLLDEVDEELASLDIDDVDLRDLKEALLQFASQDGGYTTELLNDFLIDQGFRVTARELLASDAVSNFPWTQPSTTSEKALEGWKDVYGNIQKYQAEVEIQHLQQVLANEMTGENWRRLVELKKMVAES
jgi:DNA primase